MTVIQALRRRIPGGDEISDEQLLQITEGTFVRCFAEMDAASAGFREAAATSMMKILNKIRLFNRGSQDR